MREPKQEFVTLPAVIVLRNNAWFDLIPLSQLIYIRIDNLLKNSCVHPRIRVPLTCSEETFNVSIRIKWILEE